MTKKQRAKLVAFVLVAAAVLAAAVWQRLHPVAEPVGAQIEGNALVRLHDDVESYTVPEGVSVIGTFSCDKNFALREITIPEGVRKIGGSAFACCTALEYIELPSTMKELGIKFTGGVNSPYIWFKVPDQFTSWEFFDYLLQKSQIVGTPGVGFGNNGEGYFRLTSFGSRENTIEAMQRFKNLFSNT